MVQEEKIIALTEQFIFKPVSCPVCGSDSHRLVGWRGGAAHHNGQGVRTAIVRCRNCTHLYPNPMPFPQVGLEELYTNAEEYFRGHDVEEKKKNGLKMLQQCEQRLGRRGRFLDVGCGLGEILWAARELGWEYEGVDPSADFVELARKYFGIEARAITLESVMFPDNYFDAVFLSSIFEHLYEPMAMLREINRVLRPGGILYLDAPNEDGLYMRIGNLYLRLQGRDWVVTMAPTFPPYHVQGFNPKSFHRALAQANFAVEEFCVGGGAWPFTGEQTLRKKLEYQAAKCISWIGRKMGMGSYMWAWVRKR